MLRAEGAAAVALAVLLYAEIGQRWSVFALLFLAPDLSLVGYALGKRAGAVAYNVVHTYALPAALFAGGFVLERGVVMGLALIWAAHIGADRLLGLGLKYRAAFRDTHLQRVRESVAAEAGEPESGVRSP